MAYPSANYTAMQDYEARHALAKEFEKDKVNLMRFRAQRDVYLTGFVLTLWLYVFHQGSSHIVGLFCG